MNGYKDPRRAVMFTQGTWNKKTDYYGMRIGTDPTNKSAMVSTYSNQIVDSKSPYLWMNAAEVTFLRAEGALRGWAMQAMPKISTKRPSNCRSRSGERPVSTPIWPMRSVRL